MTELPDILGEDLGYLLGWVALGETLGDDDGCEAARAMVPNTSDEEKAALKKDLHNIGVNALSTVDHGYCDACGKCTVVTDVWIDRTPMTLCQPCVLDALTAEGEQLGHYWEIET